MAILGWRCEKRLLVDRLGDVNWIGLLAISMSFVTGTTLSLRKPSSQYHKDLLPP